MKATEHKETGEKMHIYEVSFLIVPTVSEDKVADEFGAIRSEFEAAGATMIAEGFPTPTLLAYIMERTVDSKKQKFTDGYFGWVKFELPVASLSNIKQLLDKRQNVLRHLIIKTVRENTMYSAKLPESTLKNGEKPEGETELESGVVAAESKIVSGKEIDKSIDALVIS